MQIAKQQIVDAALGNCYALEILSRNEGVTFVPPAENHIVWARIDLEALAQTIKLLPAEVHVMVNLSEECLRDDRLFEAWTALASHRKTLTAEITERVTDYTLSQRWKQLRAMPICLALDDFGREYSTLARLEQFDWDLCKFEVMPGTGPLFNEHQRRGVAVCEKRRILTIAERIETKEQSLQARDLGLQLQQGFYWGHPEIIPMPIVPTSEGWIGATATA